jgi:hypothetical protein
MADPAWSSTTTGRNVARSPDPAATALIVSRRHDRVGQLEGRRSVQRDLVLPGTRLGVVLRHRDALIGQRPQDRPHRVTVEVEAHVEGVGRVVARPGRPAVVTVGLQQVELQLGPHLDPQARGCGLGLHAHQEPAGAVGPGRAVVEHVGGHPQVSRGVGNPGERRPVGGE